jgi:hypothetical protein
VHQQGFFLQFILWKGAGREGGKGGPYTTPKFSLPLSTQPYKTSPSPYSPLKKNSLCSINLE